MSQQNQEKLRQIAAKEAGLPLEISNQLKGDTLEMLQADAQPQKPDIPPTLNDLQRLSPAEIRNHVDALMKENLKSTCSQPEKQIEQPICCLKFTYKSLTSLYNILPKRKVHGRHQ